jgi:hypothetical protein
VEIPAEVLSPGGGSFASAKIKLRPLTVKDIQKLSKAAKENDSLLSILMVKEALVAPALTFEQVHGLHTGLARFLLDEVHRISGLTLEERSLADAVQEPLAKACFVLAKEFGWSPQEVGDLTMGQILFYLEMLRRNKAEAAA